MTFKNNWVWIDSFIVVCQCKYLLHIVRSTLCIPAHLMADPKIPISHLLSTSLYQFRLGYYGSGCR